LSCRFAHLTLKEAEEKATSLLLLCCSHKF
jgi:hypothetical protein